MGNVLELAGFVTQLCAVIDTSKITFRQTKKLKGRRKKQLITKRSQLEMIIISESSKYALTALITQEHLELVHSLAMAGYGYPTLLRWQTLSGRVVECKDKDGIFRALLVFEMIPAL